MTKWGTRKRGRNAFPARAPSVGVLFSGFLIAISFVAMIIPLALFHAAQVAATSRLKNALVLVGTSVAVVLMLGLAGRQPSLIVGGLVGLFWMPLFAIVLYQRMHHKSPFISAILLCLPVFILVWTSWSLPPAFDLASYMRSLAAPLVGTPSANPQALQEWESVVKSLESPNGPLADITFFSKLGFWQRLSWLVYGDGSSWLLSTLGVGLANLLFLDFAFEQIEKVRAIARFVKENSSRFSVPLVETLTLLLARKEPHRHHRISKKPRGEIQVVRSSTIAMNDEPPLLSFFFRSFPRSKVVHVMGHSFELDLSAQTWNLRHFALPIWVVALALVFLASIALFEGAPAQIIAASTGNAAPAIAIGGMASFAVLSIIAVQGVIVLLERLTPGFLLVVAVCAFIALSMFPVGAHVILGIFGILGIVDYAYDLRGHLANKHKPV
jgi:hypothetical protein